MHLGGFSLGRREGKWRRIFGDSENNAANNYCGVGPIPVAVVLDLSCNGWYVGISVGMVMHQ